MQNSIPLQKSPYRSPQHAFATSRFAQRVIRLLSFGILVMFKVLNRPLVRLRSFLCTERAQVAPSSGFGILLARVQAVLAGFEFSNHWTPRRSLMPGDRTG